MRRMPGERFRCFVALSFALAGCTRYELEDALLAWERGTGYASAGIVAYQGFPGQSGIGPGVGYTVTMPPLVPVLAGSFLAVAVGAAETDTQLSDADLSFLEPLFEASGVSGVSDSDRLLVTEVSLELTVSQSFHKETDLADGLTFTAAMLGARLCGPERLRLSYTVAGGWGWYDFGFYGASDAHASGPYLAGGFQYYFSQEARLSLEYKRMYFTTSISSRAPEHGAQQLCLVLSAHWYF